MSEAAETIVNKHNCVNCTLKHLASACVIAREILTGYDTPEYRLYLLGNLNEAQEQSAAVDQELSRLIRHLRLKLAPEALEFSGLLSDEFLADLEALAKTFSARHNQGAYEKITVANPIPCRCSKRRIIPVDSIKRPSIANGPIDLIIPLRAGGSHAENAELRFALRSIDRYLTGYRDIYVLSNSIPVGFVDLKHVYTADTYKRKQMNIHSAIKAALLTPGIAENVIFWADDNVLLHELQAAAMPTVVRPGSLLEYSNDSNARVWHQSVRNTGEELKKAGFGTLNFEAHTPVVFQREKYLRLEEKFPFYEKAGLCYISLYLNAYGIEPDFMMREVKATFENSRSPRRTELDGKTFLGYNDSGLQAGLLELLKERFPDPSRYER